MTADEIIEDLKNRLSLVTEERDCAMEMWQLTKQVAETVHSEVPSEIRKELEEVKLEYSEAIKLLESKCSTLESILKSAIGENHNLSGKIAELNAQLRDYERDKENNEMIIRTMEKEKESMKLSLEQTKEKLKVAEQVSLQARDKVADALSMAQDALSNEASIAEEKAQLEEDLANQISEYEAKIVHDVERVRTELESKVDKLSTQLHTVTLERNRFSHEIESLKAECRVVEKQLSMSNKNLARELDDVRSKRQSESTLWYEERDTLRRQVTVLQGEVETLLAQARKSQAPCPDCEDYRTQTERYKKLAKRWEEAADRVTSDFERYLQEAKDHYWQGSNHGEESQPLGRGEPV
uniref:Uncharacterized protein n=1 Tax=Lygus hesperus TaxID=30085 RepID=A0A0A9YQY9_LYGHE